MGKRTQGRCQVRAKGTSVSLTHSGLVIDTEHGWLACSPDDLVQDSSVEPENQPGLVEYKCPYSAREITVDEACKKKDFMSTTKNSEAYTQVLLPGSGANGRMWEKVV